MIVAGSYAQVAIEGRVATYLAGHVKTADPASATRHSEVQAAQSFAVVPGDRPDFYVQIDVRLFLPALVHRRACQR